MKDPEWAQLRVLILQLTERYAYVGCDEPGDCNCEIHQLWRSVDGALRATGPKKWICDDCGADLERDEGRLYCPSIKCGTGTLCKKRKVPSTLGQWICAGQDHVRRQ